MARDSIAVIAADDAGVELTGQTTIVPANGAKVPMGIDGKLILVIAAGTDTGEHVDVAIKAGVRNNSGQGDMLLTVPEDKTYIMGPFESERFEQADGNLYVDFTTGNVGTIAAIRLP